MSKRMVDPYDEQRDEVELCTTLLIASSGRERSLSQDEVDRLLGVRPPSTLSRI